MMDLGWFFGSRAEPSEQAGEETETKPADARVTAVAWMVGIVAVAAVSTIEKDTSVGAGIGYIAIAAMVAVTAVAILRTK